MSVNATSVFKDPDLAKILSTTHDRYVVAAADKAQNNIVFKTYYTQCLLSEVDVEFYSSDKTYTATTLSKEEIVDDYKSVLSSFVSLPKMMIVIYRLCTGFLNSTGIHTNNVTYLDLQNVPPNLSQNV